MMGVQLHITSSWALIERIIPVRNDNEPSRYKPDAHTGLWTSTFREETQDADWVEWCSSENYGEPYKDHWFLLTPHASARLYVIDGYADLERLLHTYKWESPMLARLRQTVGEQSHLSHYYEGIDFERLAQDYDGLHLTSAGNTRLHRSHPLNMNAWDSESTVWFRWCFTHVQHIETPKLMQETPPS